jgi:hypothetical protein
MQAQTLQKLVEKLGLEELEAFQRSMKNCPKCDSNEGFWLTAKSDRSYLQCKHCRAILEICEVLSQWEKGKDSKPVFRKLKS